MGSAAEPAKNNIRVFVVLVAAVFSAIGSIVLMANDYRNLNQLLVSFGFNPIVVNKANTKTSVEGSDPETQTNMIIMMPDGLLDQTPANPPLTFRRTISRSPLQICSDLRERGLINAEWTEADLGEQAWECSYEKRVPDQDDSNTIQGSLYVSVRGLRKDQVTSVRLKVNFLSGAISDRVLNRAVDAAAEILSVIGWGADPETLQRLRRLETFEIKNNGNRMSLFKEHTEIPRYNFLIVSDTPAGEKTKAGKSGRSIWLESPKWHE